VIFPVLAEEHGWVAVDKPPGLPVIPGRDEEATPNVRELLESQLGQRIFVVHRLDRDTSGVLLFALDEQTHRELSLGFATGDVKKRYDALVKGRVETAKTLSAKLKKTRGGKVKTAGEGEEGKPSKTRVRPLEVFRQATLLECEPLTGRTHQIRVHLAFINCPIVGDTLYGHKNPSIPISRQFLHAAKLEVPLPGETMPRIFEAPLPADLELVLSKL
jgi:RluA family pseudouridine synthase